VIRNQPTGEPHHLNVAASLTLKPAVFSALAGTPIETIETMLAKNARELAFEPMSFAALYGTGRGTIGGTIMANLSGPRRIKAGAARDFVLGVKAVPGRADFLGRLKPFDKWVQSVRVRQRDLLEDRRVSPERFRGRLIMAKPKSVQVENGRFISGNIGGGRRPKGARNQLGEAFVADLYTDWLAHGIVMIKKVRAARPDAHLKMVASILPKDVNMIVSPFEHMIDAELEASIRRLVADVTEREGPPSAELALPVANSR
jgi:FAD/FMN-containing dehydrogenase